MFVCVATLIAVTFASAAIGAAPLVIAVMRCREGYYQAASANCIHRPLCAPTSPAGATAQCVDGCSSFSEDPSADDTRHRHGGVSKILR
jgi:hypothetical protein